MKSDETDLLEQHWLPISIIYVITLQNLRPPLDGGLSMAALSVEHLKVRVYLLPLSNK